MSGVLYYSLPYSFEAGRLDLVIFWLDWQLASPSNPFIYMLLRARTYRHAWDKTQPVIGVSGSEL